MMKWKVTRSPRCASADRSSEYLRTIELPDPTLLCSPLGSQQHEKEPLTENRKQSQQGNDLSRKPSFAATDCINLKGIFGIAKDRNDAAYTSLIPTNPVERRRSRSEVRGVSADRFNVAYHGSPLSISQLPFQSNGKSKESSASKKPRSSSPGEKGKSCWVRGRRREREPRKPLLSDDSLKTARTVAAASKGPAPTKAGNSTKTNIDSSGPRNKSKAKKNERSVSKEKAARGKENKEINNNNNDGKTESKTVLPQNSSSVNKPKRIIRKKGQAPKPQQAQIRKETSVTSEKTCESSRKDSVQLIENKSEDLQSPSDLSKNMVTNIECHGNSSSNEQKTNKNCENAQEHINDSHATKMTVKAEIHFGNQSTNNTIADCAEKMAECKSETRQTGNASDMGETKKQRLFQGFRKGTAPKAGHKGEFLPVIDEPDYTPSNSDEEIDKVSDVIMEKETFENEDKQLHDQDVEDSEESIKTKDYEEKVEESVEEDTKNQVDEILACEHINTNDVITEVVPNKDSKEEDAMNQRMDTTSTTTSPELLLKGSNSNSENSSSNEECNVSNDDVTDTTELDDVALLDMSSDTLMGFSNNMDDYSPTSPTPPPRKKMASLLQQQLQQLMTVNVVVRNPPPANGTNISLTSPIISDVPADFMVKKKKKSFVLTVAKQEEGFRSLCASRDFLSSGGSSEITETDENANRISVTFLCSGPPSEGWLDNSSPLTSRMRSISVPPKNGAIQNEFISLMAASQRNGSKDRRTKDRQSSKRKSHRGRKKDAVFHMPQAVIDELSQVLETRKRVPDDKPC